MDYDSSDDHNTPVNQVQSHSDGCCARQRLKTKECIKISKTIIIRGQYHQTNNNGGL